MKTIHLQIEDADFLEIKNQQKRVEGSFVMTSDKMALFHLFHRRHPKKKRPLMVRKSAHSKTVITQDKVSMYFQMNRKEAEKVTDISEKLYDETDESVHFIENNY
jgi:hypothetical protein